MIAYHLKSTDLAVLIRQPLSPVEQRALALALEEAQDLLELGVALVVASFVDAIAFEVLAPG